MSFRTEKDFLGEKQLPDNAYYGVQTQRGKENFHITGIPMSTEPYFVKAYPVQAHAAALAPVPSGVDTTLPSLEAMGFEHSNLHALKIPVGERGAQALLEAFAHLPGFRGESSFRTWLYRIALNLASHAGRKAQAERRLREVPLVDEPRGEAASGEQRLDGQARRQALQRAVAGLPEKQRRAVELRVFEDLSFREVGEVLGCSEDAAKMNFHHGLRRLRALLAGGAHHEPGM